ncbi:hypothetical protein BO85DRAFT_308372 [Aspergillus piperis CBS 112811]|uniref:Uncharacterized protein n=1 Tax=Aspergillus piperis CBS 112811 TaxID=1448313 RepID=A0A8G1VPG2_9EURO|nr:hypothetical protein BO85DRAFT_308372 [Aspergillus piperis CBS 112811]RAH57698.1 hypothetical protein BO85DRAFT_308372 [Aspergillus piperis CBS 112811]
MIQAFIESSMGNGAAVVHLSHWFSEKDEAAGKSVTSGCSIACESRKGIVWRSWQTFLFLFFLVHFFFSRSFSFRSFFLSFSFHPLLLRNATKYSAPWLIPPCLLSLPWGLPRHPSCRHQNPGHPRTHQRCPIYY